MHDRLDFCVDKRILVVKCALVLKKPYGYVQNWIRWNAHKYLNKKSLVLNASISFFPFTKQTLLAPKDFACANIIL